MKIDPETRQQDLSQRVNFQLGFIPIEDVRSSVVVMVLIIYDIPLLMGLVSTLQLSILWMVTPFILILHLWGIRLIIKNPYSTQFEMILFMGIWGVIGAISLFIMVQGMSYYLLHIKSIYYYLTVIVVTILLSYILVRYQIDKYAGNPTKEKKSNNQSKYMGILIASPAVGYIIAQSVQEASALKYVITLIVVYFFTVFFVYGAAKFLHRYFFMKANMAYVSYQPQSSKEKKKLIKQGVEIK